GVAGEDDADRLRALAARPPQQLDAGHLRHALVGHDDVDRLAVQHVQRLGPAVGSVQVVLPPQQPTEREQDLRLVVHQQDRMLARHRAPPEKCLPSYVRWGRNGSRTRNVLPRPTSLSTSIAPPWSRTMPKLTDRPRPVPWPTGLVVKNG